MPEPREPGTPSTAGRIVGNLADGGYIVIGPDGIRPVGPWDPSIPLLAERVLRDLVVGVEVLRALEAPPSATKDGALKAPVPREQSELEPAVAALARATWQWMAERLDRSGARGLRVTYQPDGFVTVIDAPETERLASAGVAGDG